MLPIATRYTSDTQAQADFTQLLEQVEQGDTVVVVQRQGHADVAMIAADELSALLETAYLWRSPTNAKRLLAALDWSQEQLSQSAQPTSLASLRQALETELEQARTTEA